MQSCGLPLVLSGGGGREIHHPPFRPRRGLRLTKVFHETGVIHRFMCPVLFQIGPGTIYSLSLLWALGAFIAAWIVRLELKRYGHDPELAGNVVATAGIGGLLGARLLFILEEWESFTRAPFDFIFSGAGLSWYVGMVEGALAAVWVFRKHNIRRAP